MPDMSTASPKYPYSMFKGEPGTRKSTCALSYPTPQYWFSYDQKMASMILPMKHFGIDPKLVSYDDYTDWETARKKLEKFQVNMDHNGQTIKTIVIDSITSLADASIRQVMKFKNIGAKGGKSIGNISVASVEDFNAEASALQELIALTKDINAYHKVNVILIAHVIQADYKSLNGETHISRTIVTAAKRIAAKVPAYCGEVYHFNIKKGFNPDQGGEYSLLTEHTGDDFARTGLPLPKEVIFGNRSLYQDWISPAISELETP